MEAIDGRDTDFIHTPSGNRLMVHFFTWILDNYPEIDTFQIVQTKLNNIIIRLVLLDGYSTVPEDQIKARLIENGVADMEFQIEVLPSIPLPASGKHRYFISEIN